MGFFYDLGRDLAKNGRTTKNDDSSSLLQVFEGFRDAFWRLFGNILRHLGAMLGYVCLCLAILAAMLGYLALSCGKMAPKSAKIRQDGA